MANGRVINNFPGDYLVALLEDQSASGSGPWVEVHGGYVNWTFAVDSGDTLEEGATDATVDIMVSNNETRPTTATDGPITLTLTLASPAGTVTDASYKWVKAKKTAGTTPVAVTILGRFAPSS